MFEKIKKRDGRVVKFDSPKITEAIAHAGKATGEFNEREARKLTLKVLTLTHELRLGPLPEVEDIQDVVERVLLDSPYYKTAKAYILYREQHSQLRNIATMANVDLVDNYIQKLDWKIKENSNMCFSLQGLNNYISSDVTAEYWLNKIYPPEIRDAHKSGDIHVHDLSQLSIYCVGWDLKDLLLQGFKGVVGKVESAPPRHLRTALGQIVNFFYTLQGEAAGAQAISSFDTLLAPFVRNDGLGYDEVKQAMQEFVFNINIPTRVGFQCMSEDTEILTPDGWRGHDELEVGNTIKTFNIESGEIQDLPVKKLFARHYDGSMYNLKNRIQDQLISPGHRVVRKKFNTDGVFILEAIEKVAAYKSPVIIPVTGKNANPSKNISDENIKLMAWIIAEGTKENSTKHRHCHRITIYQSKASNPEGYDEIIGLLNQAGLTYSERDSSPALGRSTRMIRLNAESSQQILDELFETRETIKFIPDTLKNMDKCQARLFLDTYVNADGHEGCKITTTDVEILNGLQQVAVDAEYGFTVSEREPTLGTKTIYVLRLIDHQDTYIQEIEQIEYSGIIWCPNTDNETVIARRNGKIFITGNTPFTNITMDLNVPSTLKDHPVIIGGEMKSETYGDFQPEMDMLNNAFAEIMMEGDAAGRVFTFPIPTYNITSDFDWDNPNLDKVWKMTGKYGIPYFSNFINSDLSPEDARSMCLFPDEPILIKDEQNRIQKTTIGLLFDEYNENPMNDGWFDCKQNIKALSLNPETGKLEWTNIVRFLKIQDNELVIIRTKDGKSMQVSKDHLVAVFDKSGITTKRAEEITSDDFLLVLKDGSDALNTSAEVDLELAWFMGLFVADGNYLYSTRYGKRMSGIQISFNLQETALIEKTKVFIKKYLDYDMKFILDPRYENSLRGYIYNKAFAELMSEKYDVRKYHRLPKWIWSADPGTISAFVEGFFEGDGYKAGMDIHINDEMLANELNLLWQLIGISTTFIIRKNSQNIRVQHVLGRGASGNKIIKDKLHNHVPEFLLDKKYVRSEQGNMLYQMYGCKQVGLSTIDRWDLSNPEIEKLRNSDFAVVLADSVNKVTLDYQQDFYDVELDKNHYFVHSGGNITHNCCRLRLDNRELRKRGGGLFGANPLTGSIGVVTINLPRIGYEANHKGEFFEKLAEMIRIAADSLEIKRKVLETFTEKDLYPYSKFYLRDIKKAANCYWKNHFSTIGIIGMNEACLNFMGWSITTKEGQAFAIEVMDFIRSKITEIQEKTGEIFNLEATPAEGTSYRLAMLDKKRYPDIMCSGKEDSEDFRNCYYTNSTQLPVNYTDDIFDVLNLQDELQTKYTGGTVLHIFLGEQVDDITTVKNMVKKIATSYKLPYFTLTPTFSVCETHGYLNGEQKYCPECSARTEIYSRVVGYLRPVGQWNDGKQTEFYQRKTFKVAS